MHYDAAIILQQRGHEVYYFDGAWYHSQSCGQCDTDREQAQEQQARRAGQD